MSVCNFTQQVTPNTCLGDSLATFNANFQSLDEGLCEIPEVIGGLGTTVSSEITEQSRFNSHISTTNSFVYNTKFEYTASAPSESIFLRDGTNIPVTTFPYATNGNNSVATFSTVSLTDALPTVSLFWTASGTDTTTIYSTNLNLSSQFNDSVDLLYFSSSDNLLYVGGKFTTVGGVTRNKLCTFDLSGGDVGDNISLGNFGSVVSSPLSTSSGGDLQSFGSVQTIAEFKTLLIVGGSFQSLSKGRGLTILDKQSKKVYPFYVNGDVRKVIVVGSDLYVGGDFDYISYGAQSPSPSSGLRVYTKGLIKISLLQLYVAPNNAIDKEFASTTTSLFDGRAIINTISFKSLALYIGGLFSIKNNSFITTRNVAILNVDGTQNRGWECLIGGEVLTSSVDGNYLYIGGSFNSVHSSSQFYSRPRTNDESTRAYNAACFNISNIYSPTFESNWKPAFNGAVTSFAFHDGAYDSYVYCYGKFTKVNATNVNYLAAIQKSYKNLRYGTDASLWKINLQHSPSLINQGLIRYNNSLIVGGTFKKIGNTDVLRLARVNGVGESVSSDSLYSVVWEFGSQCCSPGMSLNMDLTTFDTVSSYPGVYGTVNQTTFPVNSEIFKNYSKGDLLRFFVRRPLNSGTFQKSAHVLGWKVDFNL